MKSGTNTVPAVNCADCEIGRKVIYAPTLLADASRITSCRTEIVRYSAERTIFDNGDTPEFIFTVHTGWLYRAIELSRARRQIISFLIPGDTVPMESLCFWGTPLPYLVRSLTTVTLCKFPTKRMLELLSQGEAQAHNTRSALQEYSTAMHRRVADIGRRSAAGRIAQLILEIYDRLSARDLTKDGEFAFPARQDDIADALSLTSVHVSRTLVDLRNKSMIEFGRDRFRILDMNAFRQLAADG